MSEHSAATPRPWEIAKVLPDVPQDGWWQIDAPDRTLARISFFDDDARKEIVDAVNSYDAAKARIAALEGELTTLKAVRAAELELVLEMGPITCHEGKRHGREYPDRCLYCVIASSRALIEQMRDALRYIIAVRQIVCLSEHEEDDTACARCKANAVIAAANRHLEGR